jgi:hypothetical protein
VHGAIYEDWGVLIAAGLQKHYEALCAFAVQYTTVESGAAEKPELWTYVGSEGGRQSVVRLTHACERAYCVPHVSAFASRAAVLSTLFSPTFRACEEALAEDPAAAGEEPGSIGCRLRWIEDSPDRESFECLAPDRAFLVVADPLLPGWTATLDGRPVPLERVDYMIRGVRVPAGHHVIEMRYLPPGWSESVPVSRAAARPAEVGRPRVRAEGGHRYCRVHTACRCRHRCCRSA